MTPSLQHTTLNATLQGLEDSRYSEPVTHYRGIKYGTIPKRFAAPLPVETLGDDVVYCTTFG